MSRKRWALRFESIGMQRRKNGIVPPLKGAEEGGETSDSVLSVHAFRARRLCLWARRASQNVAPSEAPRSWRSEGGVAMGKNVRAPLAGRNNVFSSNYTKHSIRYFALGRYSTTLAQKGSVRGRSRSQENLQNPDVASGIQPVELGSTHS
jgi:hypothetical protein